VILGNDAVVAARPWTPVQLANACWAAGYDLIIPPSWGDEIVAATYLDELAGQSEPVIVACGCPRVAALLSETPTAASHRRLAIAAPPVAAARSLRAVHGEDILITYVGDCPSATDPSIDIRISPPGLFSVFEQQGVSVADQPTELGDEPLEGWRRYRSVPGGLPALRFLARHPVERVLRSIDVPTLARGRIPPSRSRVLVDLADAAHCVCGGARERIEECEPPRRVAPLVARLPGVSMTAEPSAREPRVVRLHGPPRGAVVGADDVSTAEVAEPALVAERPVDSSVPVARRAQLASGRAEQEATGEGSYSRPPHHESIGSRRGVARRRAVAVAAVPAVVLALAAALGVGVYAASSGEGRSPAAASAEPGRSETEGDRADRGVDSALPTNGAPTVPVTPAAARDDSLGLIAMPPARDSVGPDAAARRPARRRARRDTVDVMPGWMPQGLPKFTPGDSARKPDTSTTSPPDTVRPST